MAAAAFFSGLLFSLTLMATSALADPPTRAGRVAEVIGEAWIFDADNRDWTRVTRNQTVAEGDRLRTDERSRVSLRVGSSSLWLEERSDVEFSQLDEGRVKLVLAKGDLGLRLRSAEAVAEYKVQTREGVFFAEREGLYRLSQLDRGSRADALQGRLRFESGRVGGDAPVWIDPGEQVELWWANGPRTERQRLQQDHFNDWLMAQSRNEGDNLAAVSQRYVSPEMTGVEDLDRYGRWEQAADYGNVWIPAVVAVDWTPYRYGRWAWTRHWGWSWVDDAPWGFAPFHYGRWVHWGNRWCWAPGRYVGRPVYAPALVAWVGGPAVSIGVTIGGGRPPPPHYGWYPLAPREIYQPSYHHGPGYGQRVNGDREWRDPVTVQRPRSNRDVVGAISYLPGQGGPVRAMPVSEAMPVRALPAAPARVELPAMPSQRANPGVASGAESLPWRSETMGRRERERERERGGERGGERDMGSAAPVRNVALPQPPVQTQAAPATPMPSADLPWRNGNHEQGREQKREREPQIMSPLPQQVPQRPPERAQAEPVFERGLPSRNPAFERQVERQQERQPERQQERQIERQPERARAAELPQRPPQEARAVQQQSAPQVQAPPARSESSLPRRQEGEPRRRGEVER